LLNQKTFIFFNSVKAINSLIKACNLIECNVYCSDDADGKNRATLGENWRFYKPRTKRGEYSLINFFTCKAFEGWNLKGETNAHLYVATDIRQKHTLVGINKCVQALGRWRKDIENPDDKPQLFHVFNHHNIQTFRTIDQIQEVYGKYGNLLIENNLKEIEALEATGIVHIPNQLLRRYCDDYDTRECKLNTYKVDQLINEQANNEVFNHSQYVKQAWEDFGFDTNLISSDVKWESRRDLMRKSISDTLKDDYQQLVETYNDGDVYWIGLDIREIIRHRNPLAYKACLYLSPAEMEELNYNKPKVTMKLIHKEESRKRVQLHKLIALKFKAYASYTKKTIKDELQLIYDDLQLNNKYGKPTVAKATDIKQFFDAIECKMPTKDKLVENGFKLIRPTFEMQIAA
jgi:hypothetical protein